ncbi:tRNA-modifying protein YgfZ [Celerinatantimonas sp. YJH-8]|uniref:tRNA-modifying protein YgfZ n=1 Tax=Celerinatantimonas sp. YJH-8 TaxID=3228714 RepID=UPI0038C68DAA
MELDKLCTFPNLVIDNLSEWSLTRLSGPDRQTYLQGQYTAEINGLAKGQSTLSGHCDPTGKLWSVLRIINTGSWLWLFQPGSAATTELTELKKYSVFSKVTIEDESEYQTLAVIGKEAESFIEQQFGAVIARQGGLLENGGYCYRYPNQPMRYLLIVTVSEAAQLRQTESEHNDVNALWEGLNIVAGLPHISQATTHQFIPQALNLQLLDAISFAKGCYTGQEVVARAKYRGTNKRATLRFVGTSTAKIESGQDLEMQLGEHWRRCGTILQCFRQPDGYTEVLAVVRSDSEPDGHYRLQEQPESQLTLAHLPYSVELANL